jgi:hypothetical protein
MPQYEPKLPDGVSLPPGFKVDVADPRYQALHSLAERERWSQKAFSDVLGIEARRVSAEHERARATPPPTPTPAPAPRPDISMLSTREQFAHALSNSPGRRPLP